MANNQSQDFLREMRRGIMECFDISDLRVMCVELGIDYEELAGDDKKAKVVELVLDLNRRCEIMRLWQYCVSERPKYPAWPQKPENTSVPYVEPPDPKTGFRFTFWSILIFGVAILGLLFSSTFFDYPLEVKTWWLGPKEQKKVSPSSIDRVRIALVIGNSQYKQPNYFSSLKGPEHDVKIVTAALENVGFRVIPKANATKKEILDAWQDVVKLAYGGVALLYYAGNGLRGGDDFIIPVDYKSEADAINISELMGEIKPDNEKIKGDSGEMVLYSAKKGKGVKDQSPGKEESPFAIAFSKALKEQQGDITEVFSSVILETKRLTDGFQEPCYENQFPGKFSFVDRSNDSKIAILKIIVFDACRYERYQ